MPIIPISVLPIPILKTPSIGMFPCVIQWKFGSVWWYNTEYTTASVFRFQSPILLLQSQVDGGEQMRQGGQRQGGLMDCGETEDRDKERRIRSGDGVDFREEKGYKARYFFLCCHVIKSEPKGPSCTWFFKYCQ